MVVKRVAVVGAGVIGLSCAVRLLEETANIHVSVISEEFSPNTTGDGSAGWIRPYLPGNTPVDLVRRWCKETIDYLNRLAHTPEAGILGIYSTSGYEIYLEETEEPLWLDLYTGFRQMSETELKQFNGGHKLGYAFNSLMTECKKYLPWLMKRFTTMSGSCSKRKVEHLSELYGQFDVVVNCTGIGAKELLGDDLMTPIKGQLIKVEAPWIKQFVNSMDDDLYIIPSADSVSLGGTHESGVWNKEIDADHRKRIWDGCCRLIPSLQRAKVIEEWTGLRPGRDAIRLETEFYNTGSGKIIPVVHNYGHGGSGVTLHWGCAGDTVKLVQGLLNHQSAKL